MGHAVDATCACGSAVAELKVGGGKPDFETVCAHPALCEHGAHLVTVNLHDRVHRCPEGHASHPLPYATTPELQRTPGSDTVSTWGEFELNDGGYRCPRCREFTLHFTHSGLLFD